MSENVTLRVLVVPDVRSGNGTGHLRRCIALCGVLARRGAAVSMLLADKSAVTHSGISLNGVEVLAFDEAKIRTWNLVFIDSRSIQPVEVARFRSLAPVIGLDAGEPGRSFMSYLIDSLPRQLPARWRPAAIRASAPNLKGERYLVLGAPAARRIPPEAREGILISFGGEDAAHLTEKTLHALRRMPGLKQVSVTVVRGPLFGGGRLSALPDNRCRIVDAPSGLGDLIATHRLVVTSFGLTAFEARREAVPVVLVNASRYHRLLADQAGFLSAGTGRPHPRAFQRMATRALAHSVIPERTAAEPGFVASDAAHPGDAAELIALTLDSLHTGEKEGCPVCGLKTNRVVLRHPRKSYFRCGQCGMLYMEHYTRDKIEYTREYFFTDYEKQYGKTYLEDFDHIRALARPRLERISRLNPGRTMLDVGCAFGPFMSEAALSGYSPFGVDISEDAARYVREQLAFPAVAGSILDFDPVAEFGVREFDVVTLWYVIEHFPNVEALLGALKRMVKPGGVLAFSTPNGGGISRRRSPAAFFSRSPDDHYTIWEPSRTRGILRRFGFTVRDIRVTGHHPERFFSRTTEDSKSLQSGDKKADNKSEDRILLRLADRASRVLGLGDTFEVYAVRDQER